AAAQACDEVLVRTLDGGDVEPRVRLQQAGDGPGHDDRARQRQSADHDAAALRTAQPGDLVARTAQVTARELDVARQLATERRRHDRARRPLEQADRERLLELAQRGGYRGGRHAEVL